MRLFTVHPDESIDPYILGVLEDTGGPEKLGQLIVHDEKGLIFPIGNKIVPVEVLPVENGANGMVKVEKALSIHAALVIFITQPQDKLPINFHPALSLSAFCCGEIISQYNTNQLCSLWYLNSPGCIVHGRTHWSLTSDFTLLPTWL